MASRRYASGTSVPAGKSRDEIQQELVRMGATKRVFYDDDANLRVTVAFERTSRDKVPVQYKITLPLPDPQQHRFTHTPGRGLLRSDEQAREAWMQIVAECWRALAAYVKALRIAAEAGIVSVETVLLPYAVMPTGETVDEWVRPQMQEIYATGKVPLITEGLDRPRLLRAPGSGGE